MADSKDAYMQRFIKCFILFFTLIHLANAQGNGFASVGTGAAFPKVDSHHYVSSGEKAWPNDRYTNNGVNSTPLVTLESGYQWRQASAWLPFYRLGINYTYFFPTKVKGKVEQYSMPEFLNYNYQYKIQSQNFLVTGKVDLYRWWGLMPFLSAGAGVAINNASNYAETPHPGTTPRINPGFNGDTNTYFSYVLGAGLDYIVQNNLWLSLKYEYGNQGHAQTSRGANIDMLTGTNYATDRLKTKMSSNSVIFNLIYLFDPVA